MTNYQPYYGYGYPIEPQNIIIHRHRYVSCALCSQRTRRDVATSTPTLPLAIKWTKLHSRSAKCEECKSSVFLGRHIIECTTWMAVIDLCLFLCCLFRLSLWRRDAANHMVRGARPGVALTDFGFESFHNHLSVSLSLKLLALCLSRCLT